MSRSLLYHVFGVREGYEYVKTEYVEGRVEFHLRVKEERLVCPECGHRGFDILHVATALELGATQFITFDERQAALAKRCRFEGGAVMPLIHG
jgi:predicted nucleic acid-binding protein